MSQNHGFKWSFVHQLWHHAVLSLFLFLFSQCTDHLLVFFPLLLIHSAMSTTLLSIFLVFHHIYTFWRHVPSCNQPLIFFYFFSAWQTTDHYHHHLSSHTFISGGCCVRIQQNICDRCVAPITSMPYSFTPSPLDLKLLSALCTQNAHQIICLGKWLSKSNKFTHIQRSLHVCRDLHI